LNDSAFRLWKTHLAQNLCFCTNVVGNDLFLESPNLVVANPNLLVANPNLLVANPNLLVGNPNLLIENPENRNLLVRNHIGRK
jgi:hypothetical protein